MSEYSDAATDALKALALNSCADEAHRLAEAERRMQFTMRQARLKGATYDDIALKIGWTARRVAWFLDGLPGFVATAANRPQEVTRGDSVQVIDCGDSCIHRGARGDLVLVRDDGTVVVDLAYSHGDICI